MKRLLFLLLFAGTSYGQCEGKLFPATPCIDTPCDPCGMFFVADMSVLAWQAIEEGLNFALENGSAPISSNLNVDGHFIRPDFSWEGAFKINLGMLFSKRGWDEQFRWTYFHGTSSKTVEGELFPLWAFPAAKITSQFLYNRAKGSLELTFNGFDIETGYHPFLTPAFSLRFFAGLKVAQINQHFHILYEDGFIDGNTRLDFADAKLTNEAIGAGPRLGFDSKWHLSKGFSLLGSIAGSLPLWHYRMSRADVDQNINDGAPQIINAFSRNRFWTFRSVLETALGFGWDHCFGCKNQYPLGISASYEFQYYSEQNMMIMLVNPGLLSQTFMPRGDLVFHGANLTFHIGF